MTKLSQITEKLIKSQNEDLGLALEEWKNSEADILVLQAQIDANLALAKKQAAEIEALKKVSSRVRKASYVELGIGIPVLVLGCLPIWTPEQQNIRNLLLGIGGSFTIAGGVSLTLTITF